MGLACAFGAGFAAFFFSSLRAGGAAFALEEDFDFAGIFLGFEAALAMACTQPARGKEIARLTPFWAGSRKSDGSGK
jgi:hypothetical protein